MKMKPLSRAALPHVVAAVCILFACAPAAWACPGCTEKSVITPLMRLAAHALAIWTTAFVLGWHGSVKNPLEKMLRLAVAAGLLAGAMPVGTLWANAIVPVPVFLPFYLPLSWGTLIGFPVLLIRAWRLKEAGSESPLPDTAKQCLMGFALGVLAVQTFPIINELLQGPRLSYGREFGDPSSVVLLLCRPLPLVVLVLIYWRRNKDQVQPLMMCMLLVLAILSVWLSFPLRELNGYAWFAARGEVPLAFSGRLLPVFRFSVPILGAIPLVYTALCWRFSERLGFSLKALRILATVGAVAGVLALAASV